MLRQILNAKRKAVMERAERLKAVRLRGYAEGDSIDTSSGRS